MVPHTKLPSPKIRQEAPTEANCFRKNEVNVVAYHRSARHGDAWKKGEGYRYRNG